MRTDLTQQIADLEQRRSALRQTAAGRCLTATERATIRDLTTALSAAWALRRHERAQQPQADHELIIVTQLKERTV